MTNKTDQMKEAFFDKLNKSLALRKILGVEKVESENKAFKFVKIGINSILDSSWFLDNLHDIYYDTKSLGSIYASDISNAENNFLIKELIDQTNNKDNNSIVEKDLAESTLRKNVEMFKMRGHTPDIILTNPHNTHNFWKMKSFRPGIKINLESSHLDGEIYGCQVMSLFSIPKDTTLIIDSKNLAKVLLKKDIGDKGDIEIFDKVYREEITNHKLKDINVDVKSRLMVYEIIGLKILDPKAILILRHLTNSR